MYQPPFYLKQYGETRRTDETQKEKRKTHYVQINTAYCKEEGHWSKDCQELKKKNEKDRNPHQEILDRNDETDDTQGGQGAPLDNP